MSSLFFRTSIYVNKKLSCRRDSARCGRCTDEPWNGHSRSLKVIRCCANRRGMFLLALSNDYLQPFLRYHAWFAHPYPASLPGETGKRRLGIGRHALVSGCLEHSVFELKSVLTCNALHCITSLHWKFTLLNKVNRYYQLSGLWTNHWNFIHSSICSK